MSPPISKLLEAAAYYSRHQAGPLPGVEPEPDGPETIQRRLSQQERAAFDLAVALNVEAE